MGARSSKKVRVARRARAEVIESAGESSEHLDACGFEFTDVGLSLDQDLPAAVGGVAIEAFGSGEVCGCDVDFDDVDSTADDELPKAVGGVA